jgi:hypothetical protein
MGFVAVEVTMPARMAERKEACVMLRVGMLCSRRRFVLE